MLTLLTFHPDNLELFNSNHVDTVLKQIDSSRVRIQVGDS